MANQGLHQTFQQKNRNGSASLILADEHNLKLLCAMTRRFDQPTQQIKKHIESGSVGQIYNISMTSRDNPYPKVEYLMNKPGIYSETGIHNVDMAIWLMKDTPTVVTYHYDFLRYSRTLHRISLVQNFEKRRFKIVQKIALKEIFHDSGYPSDFVFFFSSCSFLD